MLKKIYQLLEPADRKRCIGVAFMVFLTSLLNFAGLASVFPLLKMVIDGGNRDRIIWVMVGVVVFIILKNLAVLLLTRWQTDFLLRQFKHFSYQLFCRYYRRGLLFIRDKGAVRLTNDVNSLCLMFSISVLQSILIIVGEALLALLVLGSLFVLSPLAALFLLLGSLPLVVFYVLVVRKRARRYGEADLKARRKQARTVVEAFRGYADLEVNDAFNSQLDVFLQGLDTINDSRKRMVMLHSIPSLLSELAIILGLIFLLIIQGPDQLLVGGVFALAAFRLMPSVRAIMNGWTNLQQASYSVDTLIEEMNNPIDEVQETDNLHFNRAIVAEHIDFTFPEGRTVLKDFSCTIRKGECVAIQGASGAGKTTLFNVLLGFYPLQAGRITIDGVELNKDNLKAWHKLVGYVPQDIFMLQASLAENIALGSENIDEDRVLMVLDQVCLKDWVETLPEGIHTSMGEAGGKLSGGQKQRIGIARALYKKVEVLFMDEATSALDNETEHEINETLKNLSEQQRELTMIIIAHRDSSVQMCDRRIVLGE